MLGNRFFKAKKYIDKKIIETVKRERAMLASQVDSRMIAAGSGNLAKFGTLNAKIRIGEMFGFNDDDADDEILDVFNDPASCVGCAE